MKGDLDSVEAVQNALDRQGYIADRPLAITVYLAHVLQKPLFLEGEPGVGKTELASAMSGILDTQLIRLQCYEGLDASHSLYEWNYPRQMLRIRMEEREERSLDAIEETIFGTEYLIRRPLLQAIDNEGPRPPVLLIDEIDQADPEFEAFLLEALSDFQITIPELGTIKARQIPFVVLTSNRTREVRDALKRRCLYFWIPYPTLEREYRIVIARVPNIEERLAKQVCQLMQRMREDDFYKRPGIAETLDWATALVALGYREMDPTVMEDTIGCVFKYQEDVRKFLAESGRYRDIIEREE